MEDEGLGKDSFNSVLTGKCTSLWFLSILSNANLTQMSLLGFELRIK